MAHKLIRIYGRGYLHFITFSCYRRVPLLRSVRARNAFVQVLGQVRDRYEFSLVGYVVMPDHVHLLIGEPTKGTPSTVIQVLKQRVSRRLRRKKRAVSPSIDAAYGANTLEVTQGIDHALADLHPGHEAQGITVRADLLRAEDLIEVALHNVRDSLYIGAMLVIVFLFLFLFNFRTAAISCTAIPLSLLAVVIALERMCLSLNTMTLGGLSIAIGEVVDDAMIDVEDIYRRSNSSASYAKGASYFRISRHHEALPPSRRVHSRRWRQLAHGPGEGFT